MTHQKLAHIKKRKPYKRFNQETCTICNGRGRLIMDGKKKSCTSCNRTGKRDPLAPPSILSPGVMYDSKSYPLMIISSKSSPKPAPELELIPAEPEPITIPIIISKPALMIDKSINGPIPFSVKIKIKKICINCRQTFKAIPWDRRKICCTVCRKEVYNSPKAQAQRRANALKPQYKEQRKLYQADPKNQIKKKAYDTIYYKKPEVIARRNMQNRKYYQEKILRNKSI